MELFNSLIQDTKTLLEQGSPRVWEFSERDCWHEIGSSELVLQKDAAYEMGAAGKGSANYVLFTSSPKLVDKDQVLLYGPDLKDIKGDCDFARIVLLRVGVLDDDNDKVYRILKDIEFAKYHVYPEGYMVRMSPENYREQVRVSKTAIKRGASFRGIGADYIRAYKKDENVLNVVTLGKIVDEWDNAYPTVRNLHMGALGVTLGTAIGLALALPHRKVLCIDSDGSILLDPGAMMVMGNRRPNNLIEIVWDNESYDSLYTNPPLPTQTRWNVDLAAMAAGAGVPNTATVRTYEEFDNVFDVALASNETWFIVVKDDLTPPAQPLKRRVQDGIEGKYQFLRYIEQSEGKKIKPPCAVL